MELPQGFATESVASCGLTPGVSLWDGKPPEYIVDGNYLINIGLEPGPHFKKIIEYCHSLQDRGYVITPDIVKKVSQLEI